MTPTRPFACATLATAALLALAAPAQAQSLHELFETARSHDATFLALQAQADAQHHGAAQAQALRLPTVGVTAGLTRSQTRTPDSSESTVVNTTSGQATLGAQQTLFNAAHGPTIAQAERGETLAQVQLQAGEQDLVVRLAQAYFDVLAARDTLAAVDASRKAIGEQLAFAKRNFEVGNATITDTREAQARFDLNTAQQLAASNDLRVKQLALEQLVGRSGVAVNALALPAVLPPVQPASAEEWVTTAAARSPLVQQAQLGVEVAQLETKKAEAGHLPTLVLDASYTRSRTRVNGDAVGPGGMQIPFSNSNPAANAQVGLTLNVPVFAGFAVQNRIKQTLSLEQQSQEQLNGARRAVEQGTRQLFLGTQTGLAQVQALEAAEASSKLALDATQLGYQVGVRVNLDVLNAQSQLYATQNSLAQARYSVLVNTLKLKQVAGTLTPDDLRAIDALLVPAN